MSAQLIESRASLEKVDSLKVVVVVGCSDDLQEDAVTFSMSLQFVRCCSAVEETVK